MTTHVETYAEIRDEFDAYVGDIVYATMTTVDGKGRPRARVLIPVWEVVDGRPVGWLATYKTPVKAAHLAGNPHTTFSYWTPRQNAVSVDAVANGSTHRTPGGTSGVCTRRPAPRAPDTTSAGSGAGARTIRSCTSCAWPRGASR
ncbi:hypothetical protein H4W34_000718 [Actinomadura algeriensis]|uniref:Pyridoxamine 5'-phosphate oxidase N-terminal domain-containing protein n=1 Tax=Actinomadura algeriensis TaxID=1679523 RepID=A0ABR9JK10_9ACTN|nr:hypothetical protein [Actinomadura algeriensis]